jgi:hypothetical protein
MTIAERAAQIRVEFQLLREGNKMGIPGATWDQGFQPIQRPISGPRPSPVMRSMGTIRMLRPLLPLLALLALVGTAYADGTVYRVSGCGEYLFVSSESGYSVLVTNGGSGVKEGDVLVGDVERLSQGVLFDRTAGVTVFARVDDRRLTDSEIGPRIAVRCQSPLGHTLISGSVSRTSGCGSKIFVDTPQGYAILERLSGGIVADGDTVQGDFNRPGRATIEDRQSGSSSTVFVADLWLSKAAIQRAITASCRR